MDDALKARIAAHRQNIERYNRLLATPLCEEERDYLRKRIAEERSALEELNQVVAIKP